MACLAAGWKIEEVPVDYLARSGRSKVTGTARYTARMRPSLPGAPTGGWRSSNDSSYSSSSQAGEGSTPSTRNEETIRLCVAYELDGRRVRGVWRRHRVRLPVALPDHVRSQGFRPDTGLPLHASMDRCAAYFLRAPATAKEINNVFIGPLFLGS